MASCQRQQSGRLPSSQALSIGRPRGALAPLVAQFANFRLSPGRTDVGSGRRSSGTPPPRGSRYLGSRRLLLHAEPQGDTVRMRLVDVRIFSVLASLPLDLDGTAATLPACLQVQTQLTAVHPSCPSPPILLQDSSSSGNSQQEGEVRSSGDKKCESRVLSCCAVNLASLIAPHLAPLALLRSQLHHAAECWPDQGQRRSADSGAATVGGCTRVIPRGGPGAAQGGVEAVLGKWTGADCAHSHEE